MSSRSESTQSDSRTEPQKTFNVNVTSQGKHYLEIPHMYLANAGIEEGDDVGIKPINYNGQFTLAIDADSSVGITRTIRESRNQRPESLLTVPKRIATAARLSEEPVDYNSQEGRIVAIIDHESAITGKVDVYNVTEVMMSKWKSGIYAYQIPENIYDKVQPGESVWFWYDVLSDGFIFVLEVDESNAPDGAIELNVQYTEKAKSDYLVHLPKQICDGLELSGRFVKWAHDGQRIMGLLS